MAEELTITTPVSTPKTKWKFASFYGNALIWQVVIEVFSDNGQKVTAIYPTPAVKNPKGVLQPSGETLLKTLNTANLPAQSLVKRALQRLEVDGYIDPGTVTGTPDAP